MLKKHGKKAKVNLWKKFDSWNSKLVYTGTLRGAFRRIPEGQEERFEIILKETD